VSIILGPNSLDTAVSFTPSTTHHVLGTAESVNKKIARKKRGAHRHAILKASQIAKLPPGFHGDGDCLYLSVDPINPASPDTSPSRRWIVRVMYKGERYDLSLGTFHEKTNTGEHRRPQRGVGWRGQLTGHQ